MANLENNIANLEEHSSYLIPIESEENCSKESELVVGRRRHGLCSIESNAEHSSSEQLEHTELEEYPYLISVEEMSCFDKVSELVIN